MPYILRHEPRRRRQVSAQTKIIVHGSIWMLALCAALISPVILIFIVPLAIGVGADLVWACGAPIAVVLIANAAACVVVCKASGRTWVTALLRADVPSGAG